MPYYGSPATTELRPKSESDEPGEEFLGQSNLSSDNDEPEADAIGQDW